MADPSTPAPAPFIYLGASEFLINTPVTLNGTYDQSRIAKVEASAEGKYPLPTGFNAQTGAWQVTLPKGFNQAGKRWLNLRGLDASGQEIAKTAINFTVTANAAEVGQILTLKVVTDTFFKASTADSSSLTAQQKVFVKAGQTFQVDRYGSVDGHLKVSLQTAIPPLGNFGYFYQSTVQLLKGTAAVPTTADTPAAIPVSTPRLVITHDTWLKAKPADSASLPADQKTMATKGQAFAILGYTFVTAHYRVLLPNGKQLFVYKDDAQVIKDGKPVPYNADALTLTALRSTVIKRQAVDSSTLAAKDKATIPANAVYPIVAYKAAQDHILVTLGENLPGYGNTGYVYAKDVQLQRGGRVLDLSPDQIILNVPYFSQRDNPRSPGATCNVTSISMVMAYYGVRSKDPNQPLEDELLQWTIDHYGEGNQTDNTILSELIKAYGFKTSFSTTRTWAQVKQELTEGRPVVIGGDFTASGHIVVFIGFNPKGIIVNDPWGDALSGYQDTEGRRVFYPNDYVFDVVGADGASQIWAHFIAK